MKIVRFFIFFLLLSCCCSTLTLTAAPRTLDEINSEQQKKKEEEEKKAAEDAKKAEKEQQQNSNPTPVTHSREYNFADKVIGILKPFAMPVIENSALLNADKQLVELFEKASNMEKDPNSLKSPYKILGIWKKITEIQSNNPFIETANNRIADWGITIEILKSHQDNLDKVSQIVGANAITDEQKTSLIIDHFDKFGKAFGTDEITSLLQNSSSHKIIQDESLKNKTGEIAKYRCDQNVEKDCFQYGKNFAQNEEEQDLYFAKACDMRYSPACQAKQEKINRKKAEEAKIAKAKKDEEKRIAKEKERQIKEEINKAGRKKRIAIATGVFVPGLALIGGGAASLYMMSDAQKWHDKYYKKYLSANDNFTADKYRKKTKTAGDHAQLYKILGSVGIGLGAAMVTTGIVFYSIEFKEEKEVKKKYNVSIGASPMDGTLQFALMW